jgi:hypothetical protein
MCWQCEGNVCFEEDNCPYCGVYLHPEGAETSNDNHGFTPPYKISLTEGPEQEPSTPIVEEQQQEGSILDFLKPLLTLLLGSTLSIFAIILYLFNHNGVFTLQWNADIWYLYILVSLPLLWYGWRSLQAADKE